MKKALWVGLAVFVAVQVYFVRELIAALVLLGIVFGGFAALVLALNAAQWAFGFAFDRAEALVRTSDEASFSRRQLRRLRSLTAR